jgi:hypothetical protein
VRNWQQVPFFPERFIALPGAETLLGVIRFVFGFAAFAFSRDPNCAFGRVHFAMPSKNALQR